MLTLVGWYRSVDPAGAFTTLNAMADPHVTVSGTDILVPDLKQLVMAAGYVDYTVAPQMRLSSPSLLEDGFQEYIAMLMSGVVSGAQHRVHDRSQNPVELSQVEALQAWVLSDPAAAAAHYGFAWLADAALVPSLGKVRTVRATAAITLSAGVWTNGALTFPVSLKAGKYQVVGMRVQSANLVAARLVFPGMAWRPGCLGCAAGTTNEWPDFRNGGMGVWGEFMHSSPPTIDMTGATDTAEEVFLDLVYVG